MSKKILFCTLFILIFLLPSKQDPNAATWERRDTTIYARDIIAAIDRGDSIIIESCEIINPLIKKSEWPRDTIRNLIDIVQSIFYDSVSFTNWYFMYPVRFRADTFCQHLNLSGATFSSLVEFSGATFDTIADFKESRFGGCAFFEGTTFGGDAGFVRASFEEYAYFEQTTFDRVADFMGTTFGTSANFRCATFDTDAIFRGTTFGEFGEFVGITFAGDADFSVTTFGRATSFYGTVFGGRVNLSQTEFNYIEISWEQLEDHLVYDATANYKLKKYFEEQRWLDDADGVYLFLKDQERMEKKWYIRYPEYWLFQIPCGYGVKPLNTLYFSAGIIILFAFFYTLKSNSIKEIEKEFGHRRRRRRFRMDRKGFGKRFYDALYFSVHTFIIGVVSDWHPTDEFLIKTKKIRLFKFRTLSMVEGALGWILLVLFVVTLTRKFIR